MKNQTASIDRKELLNNAKSFFKETIIQNNLNKIEFEASKLRDYNVNHFLIGYLSHLLCGEISPVSIAKALLYPKILGTSITTSFGTNLQKMISTIFPETGAGSAVTGIDIEFIDAVDGRKKYCQLKAGPQTINKDDVKTIRDHFSSIKNLARTNNLDINPLTDLIIGVLYGSEQDLNANYKKLKDDYTIYVGVDLWHRITGDINFYKDLIETFSDAAIEMQATTKLNEAVNELAKEIKNSDQFSYLLTNTEDLHT